MGGQPPAIPPTPVPPVSPGDPDVLARLDMAHSQLTLFARDPRRSVEEGIAKEQDLEQARDRLRILDRLRQDFLAFVSHELRTPLSGLSAISMLEPDLDSAEQRELIQIVQAGYGRLEALIAKGLEYFQWLAVPPVREGERCDLDAALRAEAAALPRPVDLRPVPRAGGYPLQTREEHARKALAALLDNAVRFTPSAAAIRVELAPAGPHAALLAIQDEGVGFPPELASEIFRPFTLGDASHHSRGSGLSLALARAIVESWGGSIGASSPGPGKGACFTVEAPLLNGTA